MIVPEKLKFIKKISEGNFWEVLLYENTYLANRKEAVKYIRTKSAEENIKVVQINRNLFEASVLEYLKKSKYIVRIYDAEILEDGFRINMEFLEKGSVQDLLKERNFLDAKQTLKISGCVLHALEYAHNKDIFHLDIKPWNILIENENIYKLSDFGLSNIRDVNGASSFKEIYTIHTPPERLSNSQIEATEQSDIYMFGITLYRLLNGDPHLLSQHDTLIQKNTLEKAIISGRFPDRENYLPHIHKKFRKIINKCISIDLGKRYKNIREVRSDIGKVKITYNWVSKNISDELHHWESCNNSKQYLRIKGEKNSNNLWTITLVKYGKEKEMRVSKHCHKGLIEKEFYKKLHAVFDEYF